jgi:hypothetical protein
MPRYSFDIIETRTYRTVYEIEADTPEEAVDKARRGETDLARSTILLDVLNREIITDDDTPPAPFGWTEYDSSTEPTEKLAEDNHFAYYKSNQGIEVTPHSGEWSGHYRLTDKLTATLALLKPIRGSAPEELGIPIRTYEDLARRT